MKLRSLPIPHDLPAPVALALLDILDGLSCRIWELYGPELIPLMHKAKDSQEQPHPNQEAPFECFNDEIPF